MVKKYSLLNIKEKKPPRIYSATENHSGWIYRAASEGDHERALLSFLREQNALDTTLMYQADLDTFWGAFYSCITYVSSKKKESGGQDESISKLNYVCVSAGL